MSRPAFRWFTGPDALAVVAFLAATAWGVASVADGGSFADLLPAVVTALLVAGALVVRRRNDLDSGTPVLPPWFVPVVMLLAAVVGVVISAKAAVATLVMTSPAAGILAVHVAFGAGARRARTAGIGFGKNLHTLDAATRVDILVLEKDGTLTTGDLTVVSVDPHDPDHDRNLRWFAGALEKASEHRVGRAIATLSSRGRLANVEVLAGQGIRGSVDRHPVRVGSPGWMGFTASPTIWTAVGVEVDGRHLGTITVADDVRPDVAKGVGRLADIGLDVILVSSDTVERTRHVAELAKISTFHALCGPDEVRRIVGELGSGHRVATVGMEPVDGAELTISTDEGGGGIVADDCSPARVADALHITRNTAARITQSRRLTITLGLLGAAAGATGLAGPIVAAVVAIAIVGLVAIAATRP